MRQPLEGGIVLLLGIIALLSGCASIANGTHQQVPVVSDPPGAAVVANCGRGPETVGVTPTVAKLSRKADRCVITVSKDGYRDRSVILTRHVSSWFWGNLFLPYVTVPGALVDLYSGSAYRKSPAYVKVWLREETAVFDRPDGR